MGVEMPEGVLVLDGAAVYSLRIVDEGGGRFRGRYIWQKGTGLASVQALLCAKWLPEAQWGRTFGCFTSGDDVEYAVVIEIRNKLKNGATS